MSGAGGDLDSGLDPLCIILVKSGAHGGKLLFKYPYSDSQHHNNSAASRVTPCHPKRSNPFAITISEDLLNQRDHVEPTNIQNGQLHGLSDETLANLFSVSKDLCGSKFELKLNDVRFVGHPVSLEPEEPGQEGRRTTLTMFHVVIALRADTHYSIVHCYHELSQRLGLILYHEEHRVGYMTIQMRTLISAQDEVSSLPEDQQESVFSLAVERSHLARDIKTIYHDLCHSGEVRIYVNKWVELSFCLPHKVHRRHLPNVLVEPESILECLESVRPYHSILLLLDPQELLDQLSTDSSPGLRRLVRQSSPLKSFRTLACDCDLSLKQIFQLTGHLLYWGRATIIYPVCENNLYVVSPSVRLLLPHRLKEKFYEKFSESLLESLASFSLPRSVSVSPPLALHQHRHTEMIVWLLQHHLVTQLHMYVTLALDDDMTLGEDLPDTHSVHHMTSQDTSAQEPLTREEMVQEFSSAEQRFILSLDVAQDSADLAQFVRFSKYWRGQHHLEEIMYHENCTRNELLQCIDKFSSLIVKHEHEDPVVNRYWSQILD